MSNSIFHALVLNLHQPSGNLHSLLDNKEWEAKEILWALDRIPRTLWAYEDIGRVHLSLSGTLLETLSDPVFQQRVYGTVQIGDLLWHFQNRKIIDIIGTGYYHPVFPLTPPADWDEHILRWQGIAKHLFWRPQFDGFWPPEMGFCMEMIPVLKRYGYRYVIVDSNNIEPTNSMTWQEQRYKPHRARYGTDEIIVVVRDRELSDAQLSGMDWPWFSAEVSQRTQSCDFPALVTTATDGENGGWFRISTGQGNFWEYFYAEFMQQVRSGTSPIRPTFIDDYLAAYGAQGYVTIKTAAWNTGWHNGVDFLQWTGSLAQKDALARVRSISDRFHSLAQNEKKTASDNSAHLLHEAQWRLLRAETSCNFFWGSDWVDRCHADLDRSEFLLSQA